jgi:hypothetical protein
MKNRWRRRLCLLAAGTGTTPHVFVGLIARGLKNINNVEYNPKRFTYLKYISIRILILALDSSAFNKCSVYP